MVLACRCVFTCVFTCSSCVFTCSSFHVCTSVLIFSSNKGARLLCPVHSSHGYLLCILHFSEMPSLNALSQEGTHCDAQSQFPVPLLGDCYHNLISCMVFCLLVLFVSPTSLQTSRGQRLFLFCSHLWLSPSMVPSTEKDIKYLLRVTELTESWDLILWA